MRNTPYSRGSASGSGSGAAAEGIRMAAAVLMRAALRDRGATPQRREHLQALAEHLSEVAGDLGETPRPSNPPMWRG